MPSTSWLAFVPEIILAVEDMAHPTFDRNLIGEIFNLQRTAACELLQRIPGSFSSGYTLMIHKRELLLWLYKIKRDGVWERDAERRRRVLAAIRPMQERLAAGGGAITVMPTVKAEIMESTTLDSLPPGIRLAEGKIEIQFNGWQDMLFHLGALVAAIDRDHIRLRQIVGD